MEEADIGKKFLPFCGVSILALVVALLSCRPSLPTVVEVKSRWGEVTSERTQVITTIVVENPLPFALRLPGIQARARVSMNGIPMIQAASRDLALGRGRSSIELVGYLDNTRIPQWWAGHVQAGERTRIRVEPALSFFGIEVPVPPMEQSMATDLLMGLNQETPRGLQAGPLRLTLESSRFSWGEVSPESTEITGRLVVFNHSPIPIPVTRLAFHLALNDIPVAQGTTAEPLVLRPQERTEVVLNILMDNRRLVEWWPTHIRRGEVTDYSINVEPVLEVPGHQGQMHEVRVSLWPLFPYRDRLETDLLGRK